MVEKMMTQDEREWLLGLSALSIIGPLSHHSASYAQAQKMMLNYFDITDGQSFLKVVVALRDGTIFSRHMYGLLQRGKTMSRDERQRERVFQIEGHSYSYELFSKLMDYELYWSKNHMKISDLTNGIELIKLGVVSGYCSTESQQSLLESYLQEVSIHFESYKTFGIAAVMGRELRLLHLQQRELASKITDVQHALAMAYYGTWEQK
jgi:hypothetical protein